MDQFDFYGEIYYNDNIDLLFYNEMTMTLNNIHILYPFASAFQIQ